MNVEHVDLKAVAEWMSEQGLGEGPLEDVSDVTGGTQNVMLRFTRSGRRYVLRRGPRHLRPRSNSVILRETKVLAALAGSDVPHPHLIASCDDPGVLGDAVFYLMEPVDGFNAGEGLPPLHAGDPSVRFQMGLSMADALAKLGAVDHVAVGLADFGKPEGFLERQVPRWLSELESYNEYENYPGPQIPGVDRVAAWLERRRPTTWTPGIMHGDYHAANVMFSRTGPEVVAIVDWEMCTIGDPLLDLGWLLATWRQPDGSSVFSHALGGQDGLASTDDLFQRYAANTTRDLSQISWYTVLACFKLGIVIEGTLARACAGKAEKEVGDQLHAATVHLFERALTLIDNES
jgi:aminoglycoside phosphotransferase (APT) family kinase protein